MKFLTLIIFSLMSWDTFSCQILVPTSEAKRVIQALPNGVPPLWSCADKPEEHCLCADGIVWEHAEIVTEITQDELGINIEKKVLKVSESKKEAYEAELQEKMAKKTELRSTDFTKITTISQLKALIHKLIEVHGE